MHRRLVAVAGAAVLVASISGTPASSGPSGGGLSSDNVTYVTTVPLEAGLPTGARLVGKHLYVAGSKSFSIYDVSDPVAPALLSITHIGFQFANEDVDTNGKILILSDDQVGQKLYVWDVRDKGNPVPLAELPGMTDHTFSCVLGCRWAYGARGSIVDLRRPRKPTLAGQWGMFDRSFGFDVTEVAPGRILTASRIIHFLDARRTPKSPTVLAQGGTPDNRLIHSLRWPRTGRDRFFLVQGETPFSGRCTGNSGAFMTWDASHWRATRSFSLIDEFRVVNGTMVDGNPPANAFGCTNMWFQEHPSFADGGLVAAAFFEHGTRVLRVDAKGKISQAGYFMPWGGSTIAAYWITKEIVYAIDITRGIDILRVATD